MPQAVIGAAVGGAVSGGVGLLGSLFGGGSNAAEHAANVQAQAQMIAMAQQKAMYDESVAREQPWVTAGTAAVNRLGGLYNLPGYTPVDPTTTLMATPGYNWMLGEGIRGRDLSAMSRGLMGSGAHEKGLMDWGQNLALTKAWNPYISELNQLGTWGQSGAALQGTQAMQLGQQLGSGWGNVGNALAQGTYNQYYQDQANQNRWGNLFGAGMKWGNSPSGGYGSNTNFGNLWSGLSNLWGGGNAPSYDFSDYASQSSWIPGYGW